MVAATRCHGSREQNNQRAAGRLVLIEGLELDEFANPRRHNNADASSDPPGPRPVSCAIVAGLASLVALLGWLLGLLMVAQLLLVTLQANTANRWAEVIESWAPRFDLGVFSWAHLPDTKLGFSIGYGIAAIAWVIIGVALTRAIRMVANRSIRG